ncbi:MAG: flagellar assembly protein FliW [Glaciihabitans sp.]|nr:flagellar assembly protein FliW [Glaciihabitans sp.]
MSAPLTFVTPPLGFSPLIDFSLNEVDGADGLYSLTANQDADVRIFVIDAAVHLADYLPVISDEQRDSLALASADDASVLVVVNPTSDVTTVNLLAPIVVNTLTGNAQQFILENQDWSIQEPLA